MQIQSPYLVYLSAVGNPDFREPEDLGIPSLMVAIDNFEEAIQVCQQYICKYNLGGGNWTGGDIYRTQTKEKIARVSYNGRIKSCNH